MTKAEIYQPTKTAMQSGRAKTKQWVLRYTPEKPLAVEPLMGWVSSPDTLRQVRMSFDTQEEAIRYAEQHGLDYSVKEPKQRIVEPKNYAGNFAPTRKIASTFSNSAQEQPVSI